MSQLKNRLSFEDVAKELKCSSEDVRQLVVEEKRLSAVYVTLSGYTEPYDLQIVKVDDSGKVFELCYGYENPPHTAYLRVERQSLNNFCLENNLPTDTSYAEQDDAAKRNQKIKRRFNDLHNKAQVAREFGISAARVGQILSSLENADAETSKTKNNSKATLGKAKPPSAFSLSPFGNSHSNRKS